MTHSPENDAPLMMQAYLEKLRHLPQGPPLSPFTPYPEVNEPERGACVTPPGQTAENDAARDDHAYWASVCICGMSEQERTGHYPEHMDWCEVPSPLDDDEDTYVTSREEGNADA